MEIFIHNSEHDSSRKKMQIPVFFSYKSCKTTISDLAKLLNYRQRKEAKGYLHKEGTKWR